jgi:hypothetical protein
MLFMVTVLPSNYATKRLTGAMQSECEMAHNRLILSKMEQASVLAAFTQAVAIRSGASPVFHEISLGQIRLRLDGRDHKQDIRMFGCQSRTGRV